MSQYPYQDLEERIVEQVLARIKPGAAPSTREAFTPLPCAIPPPGTPRYGEVMAEVEARAAQRIASPKQPAFDRELARRIDHTLLKPEATRAQIDRLCDEALQYEFASVCVNLSAVPQCVRRLRGSRVEVCTVVGFPLGATTAEVKAFEASEAVAHGATEIDMVLNVGSLRSGDHNYVFREIADVVEAAAGRCVKVIIETCLLSTQEKVVACTLAREARATYVKTSTGFGSGGATVDDVKLMRRVVSDSMKIKAAGGIGNAATAHALIRAGADRLGCSRSIAIITET